MDEQRALDVFAALSQETRLRIVRLLVAAGPEGLSAGSIGEAMAASASNLSFHLSHLERAGLVRSRRVSRSIIYSAEFPALAELIRFLMRDCCQGHPEICEAAMAVPCCPAEGGTPMTEGVYNVLFLCTGNSARSIMAEALLNKIGRGRFRAFSAGSHPKGSVNPFALQTLEYYDFPREGLRSKPWDEFATPGAPVMDFVFTVCDDAAGEVCPVWPGQPMTAHWGIEDPATVEGTDLDKLAAFTRAFRYLKNRIDAFAALPIASLDRLALGNRLRDIGTLEGATSPRPQVA